MSIFEVGSRNWEIGSGAVLTASAVAAGYMLWPGKKREVIEGELPDIGQGNS